MSVDIREFGPGSLPAYGEIPMSFMVESVLEGRKDLAVLWDLRVHPDLRRRGVGSALFDHAVRWARGKRCRGLKIETQNVNVPACRFYARQGCRLRTIDRFGYAACPPVAHEAMLIWQLDL